MEKQQRWLGEFGEAAETHKVGCFWKNVKENGGVERKQ